MTEAQKRATTKHLKNNYYKKTIALRKTAELRNNNILKKYNLNYNKIVNLLFEALATEEAEATTEIIKKILKGV